MELQTLDCDALAAAETVRNESNVIDGLLATAGVHESSEIKEKLTEFVRSQSGLRYAGPTGAWAFCSRREVLELWENPKRRHQKVEKKTPD